MDQNKLNEWKERWYDGDMKFIPELFDLAASQNQAIEFLKRKYVPTPSETRTVDYEDVYQRFWKGIVEDAHGNLHVEQVKKELADYRMILDEVPSVYDELAGLSKPHTRASVILDRVNERMIDREMAFSDLVQEYNQDGMISVSVQELKKYLFR